MKKTLLLSVLAGVSVTAFAQSAKKATTPKLKSKYDHVMLNAKMSAKPTDIETMLPVEHNSPVYSNQRASVNEAIIGTTGYHLQTNSSVRNAIIRKSDGTMAAVWTKSTATSGWTDRGTGYVYNDGSTWTTAGTRIEGNTRTGWPSVAWTANSGEFVATHSGTGAHIVSRPTIGTGNWGASGSVDAAVTTSVWARLVADGNTLHHIVNGNGSSTTPILGQVGVLYYSRSTDGGVSWDKLSTQIPGSDSTSYLGWGGDAYAIAARDGHVAVVTGGLTVDVTLFKSDDNGSTWTKTVILAHPQQLLDIETTVMDSTFVNAAGDVAVVIDHNGIAHVSFSGCAALATGLDGTYSYYPGTSDLLYWNQHMGAGNYISLGSNAWLDFNNNQIMDIPSTGLATGEDNWGSYEPGFYSHPSLGVDASNNVYLAYDALAESGDTTVYSQAYRHVFVLKSMDGGYTWSDFPTDVVPLGAVVGGNADGEYQEAVWPSMAPDVDGNVHIVYHRDAAPGIQSVSGTPVEPDATNNASIIADVIYVAVPVGDINVGMVNEKTVALTSNAVSVFPNPAKSAALVNVNLTQAGKLNVTVFNALGTEVINVNNENATVGMNSVKLNTSTLSAGVYFIKTNANGAVNTTKLIVE